MGVQTSFKAGNPNDDTRTHWGFVKSHSLTPTNSTPQELSIQADPAFLNGVRDFEYDTRYDPASGAGRGQEIEFIQEFVVPEDATYKLECWGASSQVNTAWYGYGYPDDGGGYTKGDAKLEARNCLYICVGGVGIANNPSAPQGRNWGGFGGYNGGSNPRNGVNRKYLGGCGGGGATHIGFKKQLLSAFTEDYASNLLWLQVAAVEIVMIIQVDMVVEILLEHARHIMKVLGWLLIMMLMVILLVRKIQMYLIGITLAMEYQEGWLMTTVMAEAVVASGAATLLIIGNLPVVAVQDLSTKPSLTPKQKL